MNSQEETLRIEAALSLDRWRAFLKLPLAERRRILARQAGQIAKHYEIERVEREHWQGGDIAEC
jgi:hypothetical protein